MNVYSEDEINIPKNMEYSNKGEVLLRSVPKKMKYSEQEVLQRIRSTPKKKYHEEDEVL